LSDLPQWHIDYEAVDQPTKNGFRQSTCVGIGGTDHRHDFVDLMLFERIRNRGGVLIGDWERQKRGS
jgi:hypothetical protein